MSNQDSILLISGSPSPISRSASLLERLARALEDQGRAARVVYPSDFPPSQLIQGNIDGSSIAAFRRDVLAAPAVVLGTPIYKGTYSGLLKILVDFIPPEALAGKPVLGVATGRLDAHFPLVSAAFEQLFAAFRDARALPTLVFSDYHFLAGGELEEAAEAAFQRTSRLLLEETGASGVTPRVALAGPGPRAGQKGAAPAAARRHSL